MGATRPLPDAAIDAAIDAAMDAAMDAIGEKAGTDKRQLLTAPTGFTFWPSNHSVVRAEYLQPCIPYDYVWAGEPTFFSEPMESEPSDPRPTWDLEVNSTEPIFFYW